MTTVLHAAPLGFDASTFEIWGALLNGGKCVLHGEAVPTGPGLARSIQAHHVTTAWLTAALFNAIVDDDPSTSKVTPSAIDWWRSAIGIVTRALKSLPDNLPHQRLWSDRMHDSCQPTDPPHPEVRRVRSGGLSWRPSIYDLSISVSNRFQSALWVSFVSEEQACARLFAQAGVERGTLCRQSVWRRRRQDVQDWRSGALFARWQYRIHWA